MRANTFTLISLLVLFAACSKDDTPMPEPMKVTEIVCTKYGTDTNGFSLKIQYNTQGNVSAITDLVENTTYNYQYNDNKLYVVSNKNQLTQTEYTLSGGRIANSTTYAYNPYKADEQFVWDKFTYEYTGSYWVNTVMEGSRFSGEEVVTYPTTRNNKFQWTNGNIETYTSGEYYIMTFEYGDSAHPTNYPYRILNSLPFEFEGSLVQTKNFSPLNLMMGNNNRNLVKRAYWYMVPDIDKILGEYTFEYDISVDGYVKEVTIREKIEGESMTNTYWIKFEYGYNPN